MTIKTKLLSGAVIITALGLYGITSVEFVQKWVFDKKADLVGTNRTVTFYSKINGTEIVSFTDKDTRFTLEPTGDISVWLGNQNKKVVSNMDYVIIDN